MRRALLLDRDGVINVDHGYVGRPENFEVIPGIVEVLRAGQEHGYLLIVVTNQSGIARGYFTVEDYAVLEAHMRDHFSKFGITFTDIYHCPHHPQGIVPDLAVECSCRKPAPGLILHAADDHDIDLGQSILLGDKQTDIEAATAAGVGRAILIRNAGEAKQSFTEVLTALKCV